MSSDPMKNLEDFLSSKPEWIRRSLQNEELTDEEKLLWWENPEYILELTEEYEQILRGVPSEWRKYRTRVKRNYGTNFASILLPVEKRGRKPNDELAQQIWILANSGKTSRQIQSILEKSGTNLTVEAIESYRKKRRLPREK